MAKYQSHVTFSTVLSAVFVAAGIMLFGIYIEQALLAGVILVFAGLLPNVDSGHTESTREFGALLAAIVPLILIEFFPFVKDGGVSRLALVIVTVYLFTRLVVVRMLQSMTATRGMLHSIPAAIITTEVVYLFFFDLFWKDRLYVAIAAFIGFASHLLLDGYTNVDLLRAFNKSGKRPPAVFKMRADSAGSTIAAYLSIAVLGYFVMKDLYPHLNGQIEPHLGPVKELIQ